MIEPVGTNPTGGGQPAGTPAEPAQEYEDLVISDKTKYKIPKGSSVPEPVLKGLREKETYIQRLEAERDALKGQHTQVLTKLEQAFKPQPQPEELPDPIENPKGYRDALAKSIAADLTQRTRQEQQMFLETTTEVATLNSLIKDYLGDKVTEDSAREMRAAIFSAAKERGLLADLGDGNFHFKRDAARMIFRDLYFDAMVDRAKKAGLEGVQSTIAEAQNAPTGVSAQGVPQGRKDYTQLTEAERYAERKRLSDEEDRLKDQLGMGRRR